MEIDRRGNKRYHLRRRHISLLLFILSIQVVFLPCEAQTVAQAGLAQLADSLEVVVDSLESIDPVFFGITDPGTVVADTLPVRTPVLDAAGILADVPGSFVFDFGTPGWPDGWSYEGINPNRVALLLNGMPFQDLLSGRPLYNLLPLAFVSPLRLEAVRLNNPVAVHAHVRAFEQQRPLTELFYRGGGNGLQSIDALHMQQRSRRLFGRPGLLQFLGTYSGRKSDGEYPGSKLVQGRQVQVRLRYRQTNWSLEVYNLHNRRRIGAHGGVIPDNSLNFDSIYRRAGANVSDSEAVRRIKRNDLMLAFQAKLIPGLSRFITLSAYRNTEENRFHSYSDTLSTDLARTGFSVSQPVLLGTHGLLLRLEGWTDRLVRSNVLFTAGQKRRSRLHATVRDSVQAGRFSLVVEGSAHFYSQSIHPGGYFSVERHIGEGRLFAEVSLSGQPGSWIDLLGLGNFAGTVDMYPTSRTVQARSGVSALFGAFDVSVAGFIHHTTHPVDYYISSGSDTISVQVGGQPQSRLGIHGNLGWRRSARRGFYLTARPTVIRWIDADASDELRRIRAGWPSFNIRGRLGLRYVIFKGDLDFDLYLQGQFWTQIRSRTLHQQSALLVLPHTDSGIFGPSGILSVVMEAGIRTAKVFVAWENILSGTTLLPGNLVVPVYPLPARRFRFGVYWPIFD